MGFQVERFLGLFIGTPILFVCIVIVMNIFIKLENMDNDELKYTREQLVKYCQLDTYAMVKIFEKLKDVVK